MVGIDGARPIEVSTLKNGEFQGQEVAPGKVNDTVPCPVFASVGGQTRCRHKFEYVSGGPFLKKGGLGGRCPPGGGPCKGV